MNIGRIILGIAALLAPACAGAATFSILGTVPGAPGIGAATGNTVFGVTPSNGADGSGALFQLAAGNRLSVLHQFTGATDGSVPTAPLARDQAGNLTGIATYGGANGGGTLWRYTASGQFTVLHAFGGSGDGATPLQGPVRDSAGDLFGTTAGGAVSTNGNAFEYAASGAYASLHDFLSGADGHCPFSGLTRSAGGMLFGTTVGNGFGGNPTGSVWKLSPSGTLTTLYVFTNGADGEYPMQAPVLDNAGNLYGTTAIRNGSSFAGALYRISPTQGFTLLHAFVADTDGAQPNGPLMRNTDGNIYGTTATGGPGGQGTVFAITPAGAFSVLHAFTGGADGGAPTGGLAHNASGIIFGGTGSGQVFRIKP